MQSVKSGFSICGRFSGMYSFAIIFFLAVTSSSIWAQQAATPGPASTPASTTTPQAAGQQPGSAPGAPAKPAPELKPMPGDQHPSQAPELDPKTGVPLYETIQEDWSSLDIGTSKLEPEPPLPAEIDDGDGYTRTLVQLKWRPGDPLDLYVILPKGVKKPPAVLYLYGYLDDTETFKNNGWCQRATRDGTAAIGFVSALSTSRFPGRPMEQWFVSELQESLGSTVHDVHFILDYLAKRGDIDMERIGMFGQASGGTIALLAAAADPRIKAVDVLDPWGDWPVWLADSPIPKDDPHHLDFTKPEFLKKVAPLDPVKWLPTLKTADVRIQQVMANKATPNACKDAIRAAAPKQAEVVRFDNVNDLARTFSEGKLFDWIKAELKNLPASGPGSGQLTAAQASPQGAGKNGTTQEH